MPSVIGLEIATDTDVCVQARRACMPTFVFSVEGQIAFRNALAHVVVCRKKDCVRLRQLVLKGMRSKLETLFTETIMLGCVHVQPHVYGARRVRLTKDNLSAVCQHLAHCPREACAQLRRSLMLSIRDFVSPNAQVKT